MRTIKETADLTGISVRTLQYYDEIGILKPTETNHAGYRFYDDSALEKLQHILFFKELDFSLKDIKTLLEAADYNRQELISKQKNLLTLKRDRMNRLLKLLERLEKGEHVMNFKEFDMSEYIEALEQFKAKNTEDIVRYWGSIHNFDYLIQKVKEDEINIARTAVKHYGSIEKYTEAMKYNLEHFSELMEQHLSENTKKLAEESDALYSKLTSDLTKEVSSDEIQYTVQEIKRFIQANGTDLSFTEPYWDVLITAYSNDYVQTVTDSKYGRGASDYIVKAFKYFAAHPRDI